MTQVSPEDTCLTLELCCSVELCVLPHIRRFVSSVAEQMGFSEVDVGKIEIAVDEACANAINHAYINPDCELRDDDTFWVKLEREPDRLTVKVIDRGIGSEEGLRLGVEDLEEYLQRRPPHGLGAYIMKRFMDEVVFHSPPGQGTEVTLVKNLEPTPDATPASPAGGGR